MRPIDLLMDRLAELAAGAEPRTRFDGICWDVARNFDSWAFDTLAEAFMHMGLHDIDPLGDVGDEGDRWSGRRGQRRRRLCYDLLVQFVASAGYRGRYQ